MNLNTKQQTMQYTTIPDGDGGGDDVVVRRPTPWWTGRSYSVLGGLVLLLVAAVVVRKGSGGPRGVFGTLPTSAAEGMVLGTISAEGMVLGECGFCYAGCCGPNGNGSVCYFDAPGLYDPKKYFCYHDIDNAGKYCWYPDDIAPVGNWKGEGGHAYNDCGPMCIEHCRCC